MNAAARVVSDTGKFDHGLTQILHNDLHWLDVADRVKYKLGVIMHRCQHGKAPRYLVDCCTPVTDVAGRQRLRSATHQLMVVPRHWFATVGRRAFAVQGPCTAGLCPSNGAEAVLAIRPGRPWHTKLVPGLPKRNSAPRTPPLLAYPKFAWPFDWPTQMKFLEPPLKRSLKTWLFSSYCSVHSALETL